MTKIADDEIVEAVVVETPKGPESVFCREMIPQLQMGDVILGGPTVVRHNGRVIDLFLPEEALIPLKEHLDPVLVAEDRIPQNSHLLGPDHGLFMPNSSYLGSYCGIRFWALVRSLILPPGKPS